MGYLHPAMDPKRLAGRFADWRPLGEGAGGRLFRVRDRWRGHEVALKAAGGPAGAEALVREFRLLSRLRHPCLIESLDLVRDEAETAHLLEYVPAVDPRALWKEGGEAAVWAALLQALRGLTFLHRHGYVHGDVAPGNVLVWRDGDAWRAKVADFGLARTTEEAATGGIRGTPGFLAPECARGDASGPASDLYALAATALVWIDGRGGWDGLSGAEQLKRAAASPDVPPPRRRVSPELEALLRVLGRGEAGDRSPGRWTDHRERGDAWGPETLVASVAGVDDRLEAWNRWLEELPMGQVGSILIRGRTGSGRKTLARAMARSLVGMGWTALWDLPLEAVRDWLDAAGGDPDPVRLARELERRFAGKDIVLLWPSRRRDLESRLLRAFTAGRADQRNNVHTVILKWVSAVEDDPDDDWLRGSSRFLEDTWNGPDAGALEEIAIDLFPPEEGYPVERRAALPAGSTPLSGVLLKRGGDPGVATAELGEGAEAVRKEVLRIWEHAPAPARDALVVLAWSDGPWSLDALGKIAGWDAGQTADAAAGIGRARLTRRTYEGDRAEEFLADRLTRDALVEAGDGHFSESRLDAMAACLEADEGIPVDLGLAGALWRAGRRPVRYLARAMERSLGDGRYGPVLDAGRATSADLVDPAAEAAVWNKVLRAARRLGKYPEQVEALERLIALAGPVQAVPHRKELAQALGSLGRWGECLEQCDLVERASSAAADRLWAKLQRAETFWQEGRFDDADVEYATIEPLLGAEMKEEWLRFGVGRARQFGQRGAIKDAARHLGEVRKQLGEDICESDPMYLITLGAVKIRQGDPNRALIHLQRAAELTSASGYWTEYLRATTRISNVAYGLGEVLRAAQTAAESFAVATAFGNDRLIAIVDSYLGHYEVDSGNLGSALRRARRLADVARILGDENQEIQGRRLIARIAALSGWKQLMEDAVEALREKGSRLKTLETHGHAEYCEAFFYMGNQDWGKALESLHKAKEIYKGAGLKTEEVEVRLYQLICRYRVDGDSRALQELEALQIDAFPILMPISQLARIEMNGVMKPETEELAAKLLEQLWDQGRIMELIEWAPRVLSASSVPPKLQVKQRLIGAVQKAVSSLDDPDLRNQFLSFPKTRYALQSVTN